MNLNIQKDFENAKPLSDAALSLVWAGARSTYGIKKGKVLYEVQLTGKNKFYNNFPDEKEVYELRCGWSTPSTNLQLGENPLSFAYGSIGKKALNNEFSDYGIKYGVDDIIGVYLNMESEPCTIEYTVNGKSQGVAFEFNKSDLGDEALFPHIISKNIAFRVNFGQIEGNMLQFVNSKKIKTEDSATTEKMEIDKEVSENKEKTDENNENKESATDETTEKPAESEETAAIPTETQANGSTIEDKLKVIPDKIEAVEPLITELLEGYIYVNKLPEENLSPGPKRPETRQECEVYMLVGLPGAGKTFWAENHAKENLEKRFNILGTNSLLERMKVESNIFLLCNFFEYFYLICL